MTQHGIEFRERPLLYNGVKMNDEPRNISLFDCAAALLWGEAVSVQLEPGDGTRYALEIIPLWAPFVLHRDDHTGVLVVYDGQSFTVERGAHFYGESANLWTNLFLSWWFDRLWYAMRTLDVAYKGARVRVPAIRIRCLDCGKDGERTGHGDCRSKRKEG